MLSKLLRYHAEDNPLEITYRYGDKIAMDPRKGEEL